MPRPIPARVPYSAPQTRPEYDPQWTRTQFAILARALSPMVTRRVVANARVEATDDTLLVDTTAGAITITLLPAFQLQWLRVQIKNIGVNNVTVVGMVDASPTTTLTQWQVLTIQSDGVAWYLLGLV